MTPARSARRSRLLAGGAVVVAVAVFAGALAQLWYRTVSEGEQEADQRGVRQVAALLLRRLEREGPDAVDVVVEDFDAVVAAHIAVVVDGNVRLSTGSPAVLAGAVADLSEPRPLLVRSRRTTIAGEQYDVVGGATSAAVRAYVVRAATPPERATTLRPAFVVGWAVTVIVTAAVAFAVGRARAAGLRRSRERERRRTAAMAHEIRTPLASVVTAADLVTAHVDELPAVARRPARVLATEVARLRTLVEDLLELARLEAGDGDPHVEQVALADVVRDVVSARGWDDRVRTDLDDRVAASVDRMSMNRIVLNLVDNALRHGGDDVRLSVSAHDGAARLTVWDSGHDVTEAELTERLQGEMGDRTARRRGGLGLRIAQQNAELHGSGIDVRVDPGAGTSMSVQLPAVEPIER